MSRLEKVLSVVVVILLFASLFFMRRAENRSEALMNEKILNQKFTVALNSMNQEVLKQDMVISTNVRDAQLLLDSIDRLNVKVNKIASVVRNTSVVTLRDTFIAYDTTKQIINGLDTVYMNCGTFNDPWITLETCSDSVGFNIEELSIRDTTTIVIARKGFFRTKYEVTTINKNPYRSTTSANSIIIKKPKNRIFKAGVMMGVGAILLAL